MEIKMSLYVTLQAYDKKRSKEAFIAFKEALKFKLSLLSFVVLFGISSTAVSNCERSSKSKIKCSVGRRNSWQLWENFSQVAMDVGNINQVEIVCIQLPHILLVTYKWVLYAWNIPIDVKISIKNGATSTVQHMNDAWFCAYLKAFSLLHSSWFVAGLVERNSAWSGLNYC